ncbi:hypothetical protein BDV10DRAFT_155929 [Aspergillus recurvatus]
MSIRSADAIPGGLRSLTGGGDPLMAEIAVLEVHSMLIRNVPAGCSGAFLLSQVVFGFGNIIMSIYYIPSFLYKVNELLR